MNTTESQRLFTPHKLSALRYRFLVGDVELTPLRVLASRTLPWNDWQITLHILGASHAVRLQRGDVILTELLTCLPPAETPDALLTLTTNTRREKSLKTHNLSCCVRLQRFSLEEGDALHHTPPENLLALTYPLLSSLARGTKEEEAYSPLLTKEGSGAVLSPLPQRSGEPGEGAGVRSLPVTRIGWRFANNQLLIETVHTYPEEGLGLRSLTRFTLVRGL